MSDQTLSSWSHTHGSKWWTRIPESTYPFWNICVLSWILFFTQCVVLYQKGVFQNPLQNWEICCLWLRIFAVKLHVMQYFSFKGGVLTSLLGGEFHRVAGRTLKATVGHNHEHLVFRVRHQVTEDGRRLSHGAVETFGPILLTDHQTCNQTGLTPAVQLGGRRRRNWLMGTTCRGGWGDWRNGQKICTLFLYEKHSQSHSVLLELSMDRVQVHRFPVDAGLGAVNLGHSQVSGSLSRLWTHEKGHSKCE